jgi:L-fuculose-phosphate aldolase
MGAIMTSDVRQLLVDACRILAANGQEHFAFGHVSAREAPRAETFWFKGGGLGLGEMTVDELIRVDFAGNRLEGSRPVHNEYPIHAEIFRARPEITCVVHTHPFQSAALAATAWDFRQVGQDSVNFWDGVGRYDTSVLVTDAEKGRELAEALGTHHAAVLANHGIVTAGETVVEATYFAIEFERAVQLQASALAMGTLREMPREELDQLIPYLSNAAKGRAQGVWDWLLRQADRQLPRG